MKRSILTLGVAAATLTFAAACGTGNDGADSVAADTATLPAMDTVNVPTTVPTTDTVITKTQTTTDTLRGDARDTTRRNP